MTNTYSRKHPLAELARKEREVAAEIKKRFKLGRAQLWNIRIGLTVRRNEAHDLYLRYCRRNKILTLNQLQKTYPVAGERWSVKAAIQQGAYR